MYVGCVLHFRQWSIIQNRKINVSIFFFIKKKEPTNDTYAHVINIMLIIWYKFFLYFREHFTRKSKMTFRIYTYLYIEI